MGGTTSAVLGSTNKFFIPWLIPRNNRDSVYAPNLLGKLVGATGRKRRDVDLLQGENSEIFILRLEYCEQQAWKCYSTASLKAFQEAKEMPVDAENIYMGKFATYSNEMCRTALTDCLDEMANNAPPQTILDKTST